MLHALPASGGEFLQVSSKPNARCIRGHSVNYVTPTNPGAGNIVWVSSDGAIASLAKVVLGFLPDLLYNCRSSPPIDYV